MSEFFKYPYFPRNIFFITVIFTPLPDLDPDSNFTGVNRWRVYIKILMLIALPGLCSIPNVNAQYIDLGAAVNEPYLKKIAFIRDESIEPGSNLIVMIDSVFDNMTNREAILSSINIDTLRYERDRLVYKSNHQYNPNTSNNSRYVIEQISFKEDTVIVRRYIKNESKKQEKEYTLYCYADSMLTDKIDLSESKDIIYHVRYQYDSSSRLLAVNLIENDSRSNIYTIHYSPTECQWSVSCNNGCSKAIQCIILNKNLPKRSVNVTVSFDKNSNEIYRKAISFGFDNVRFSCYEQQRLKRVVSMTKGKIIDQTIYNIIRYLISRKRSTVKYACVIPMEVPGVERSTNRKKDSLQLSASDFSPFQIKPEELQLLKLKTITHSYYFEYKN